MGRKGKKGDFLDLDDPEAPEQAQPAEEEPVNAAKPKGKKGKKGKSAAFADEDEEETPAVPAAAAPAAPKAGGKKQQKGKKGGNKFDFGSDDDKDFDLAPAAAASDDEDETFAARPAVKPKAKGKAKQAAPASAFDLLNEDGSADEQESELEDEQPVSRKGSGAAAGFAALDDGDEAAEESEEEGEPVAAAKPSQHKKGKKDKKGKDMNSLFAALEEDGAAADEPAAAAEEAEDEPAPAAQPSKSSKSKKGKKDVDSLFAALEEDGAAADEPEAAAADAEVDGAAAKVSKSKKGKKDMSSLFAALEEDGTAAVGGEAVEKKEKKKKPKKDMDSLFAALEENGEVQQNGVAEHVEDDKPAKKEKKDKKSKKDKSADIDNLMAQMSIDEPSSSSPAAAAAAAAAPSPSSSKKKKGKVAAEEDDEELAAILAELEAPKQQQQPAAAAAAEAGSSKKKKKKGKGGAAAAAAEDDDIDALLAQIDGPVAQPATAAAAAEPAAAAAEDGPAAAAAAAADDDDEPVEGKELTAAQKKKLKKKQKEKEKKAAAAGGADETESTAAAAADEAAAAAAGGKKGKPVKESAAVRRMREQLEARQRAEEEARAAEEAARKAAEEEERRLEEEERRKAEEKERKKAAAKAKKEELKRQGKLLTGKAKAEAERLAAIRAKLLADAAEKGLSLDEAAAEDEEAEKKPKKVVYTSKKKGLQRKKSEASEVAAEDEQQQQLEQPAAAAPAAAPEPAAAEKPESEGLDDWEQAADSWEELDKEPEQPAAAAAAQAKEPVSSPKKAAAAAVEEEEEEEESSEEEEEDEDEESVSEEASSEEESSEEESSSYESSDEDEEDSDEERERRIEEAREKRLERLAKARESADKSVLRSPICCILGHVDVGKTKILDNIRRTNVQDGEAGGITQQIGATFVPADAIDKRTAPLRGNRPFDMKLPGLLVIDTPGHESFTNLRARGSGLCDIAVLIVDLMHGLEQQTIESINMLKMRKTPFIIALNKCDRLYGWKSVPDCPIRDAFKRQKDHVMKEFDDRSSQVFLQLNEQGLNVSLYWKNTDPRKYVNVVPTSAITGEGIPDLLQLMVKLTQSMMQDRLTLLSETQATVLEVKTMEGLGTTVDVVLVNGTLKEGDRIVVCGLGGPIVTRIKSLKTPQVLKEMRVKGQLVEHKEVRAAMGVKIVAPGLESAVAGTSLYVMGPDDDEEELKETVMEDMADIFSKVDKSGEGVCVQASTLGSLEALLTFLDSDDVQIPVSGINIGPIHKKDVLRANVMNEKGSKKYAVILAFDIPVSKEARELAVEYNVKIFTADIIYHLFDQFTAYMKQIKSQEQEAARLEAVFPCTLQILPQCVFNKKDPIVVGVDVVEGIAKVGTPLAVPTQAGIELGRIASLELNHKAVDVARAGQSVAMKIEAVTAEQQSRMYGRHFDHNDQLVSKISRESINALKAHFADEMTKDDWRLVVKLKKVWGVQ